MPTRPVATAVAALILIAMASASATAGVDRELAPALAHVPAPSGVLIDRTIVPVELPLCDGTAQAPALTAGQLRRVVDALHRAADSPAGWPRPGELRMATSDAEPIVLALINQPYQQLSSDALGEGFEVRPDTRTALAFAAAALVGHTHRGESVRFVLPSRCVLGDALALQIDLDDGRGWRPLPLDTELVTSYRNTGRRILQIRHGDLVARAVFDVLALDTPDPSVTWLVTADQSWGGANGSGLAYVYLAPGHTQLTNPVVVVEGFDLNNTLAWPELYALLNTENLLEDLRARGFDTVVLDFNESTDPIQRNAFVLTKLLAMVDAELATPHPYTLVGASMGGLVSRYALTWLEDQGRPHQVETFISFDGALGGANIPLGLQHWLDFFAPESDEAAYLLSRLERPAARQMLLSFHQAAGGGPDGAFLSLSAELENLGGWPQQPRLVAVANGSGAQADQGYDPGAQLVSWEYSSLLVDVVGNVWAVPDQTSGVIFDGEIDLIWPLPDRSERITVGGLRPVDGAPGGWRASMTEVDQTEAPYGDIQGLHPNHAFIPTISALALDTEDLFYDVAGDPEALALTPFDAIYYPALNEEHVLITPAGRQWLLDEIGDTVTGSPDLATPAAAPRLFGGYPNPFNPSCNIAFALPSHGQTSLQIIDLRGRRVTTLVDQALAAGQHTVTWDGRSQDRRSMPAGVYLVRLTHGGHTMASRVTLTP